MERLDRDVYSYSDRSWRPDSRVTSKRCHPPYLSRCEWSVLRLMTDVLMKAHHRFGSAMTRPLTSKISVRHSPAVAVKAYLHIVSSCLRIPHIFNTFCRPDRLYVCELSTLLLLTLGCYAEILVQVGGILPALQWCFINLCPQLPRDGASSLLGRGNLARTNWRPCGTTLPWLVRLRWT